MSAALSVIATSVGCRARRSPTLGWEPSFHLGLLMFSCSFANECSEVCPKNVDPAAAVNQAKFGAVIDWATSLVLPRGGSSRGDE